MNYTYIFIHCQFDNTWLSSMIKGYLQTTQTPLLLEVILGKKMLLFLVSILNMLWYIHFYTHYLVFSYSITCWLSVGTCLQIQITEQMSESDENCNNGITLDYLQSFYSFSHFSWTYALHRYLNCNLLTRNIISIFHNSIASE